MEKRKAIVTTVLLFGLLAATDACLFVLHRLLFAILTGSLAGYGFGCAAVNFCRWLYKTELVELVETASAPNPDRDAELLRVLGEGV